MNRYVLMRLARNHLNWTTEEFFSATPAFSQRSLSAEVASKENALAQYEEAYEPDIRHYDYIDDIPEKLRGAIFNG